MTLRTINRNLIVHNDLNIGYGTEVQNRGDQGATTEQKIELDFIFRSIAEIKALDEDKYTRVSLHAAGPVIGYYFDPTSGAIPDDDLVLLPDSGVALGRWLKAGSLPVTYGAVSLMVLASPEEGQMLVTDGYYEPGDDGHGTYLVEPSSWGTPDEYSDFTLANGNIAVLMNSTSTHNVRQYGTVGDGVANDTLAIQAAIDKISTVSLAASDLQGGGEVFIPEGIYLISTTLQVSNPGITIRGVSSQATRINSDGIMSTDMIVFGTGSPTCTKNRLLSISLDGGGATVRHGVCLDTVTDCLIHDVSVYNTGGNCIKVDASTAVTIDQCKLVGSQGDCVYISTASTGCMLLNNRISDSNNGAGVNVTGNNTGLSIKGNTIANNGLSIDAPGILLTEAVQACTIDGNLLVNNRPSSIEGQIQIGRTTATLDCTAFVVTGNRIVGNVNSNYAIGLETASNGFLTGNSSVSHQTAMLYLGAGLDGTITKLENIWADPAESAGPGSLGFSVTDGILSLPSAPDITGSRAGNAALADLLTKLAAAGLITDSTT